MPSNKAVVIREFGSQELSWEEVPLNSPGQREIAIRMRAVSLNYRDYATINGNAPGVTLPLIPLSDGVGHVVDCGEGVTRFKPGDRVCPMFFPRWISGKAEAGVYGHALGGSVDGVCREYLTLHEDAASGVPEHLSDVQAATLPCAALTAWTALTTGGGIAAGDVVVLQGTGGVSICGLQLAKSMGAETIVTSSDDAKLERAQALGADHVINYLSTPDWGKSVKVLTGGRGADRVLDVGGTSTLLGSMDAMAQNGRVVIIGVLGGYDAKLSIAPIMMQHLTLEGITVGNRAGFEAMSKAIELHRIEPVVDTTFPVEQLRLAIDTLKTGKHFGKLALSFG